MDEGALDEAACVADFLQLWLDDVARGEAHDAAHYVARFPGHEDLVAREHAALRARAAATLPAPALPALDGYRLLRELGRGGQGTVYLAEDLALRRPVALKVVRSALGRPSAAQRARLEREVGVLARLDHPGICTVYRAHLDADPPFVAMRYVPGPTLAELVDGTQTSAALACPPRDRDGLERALRFFEDAARALHAAHEAGVVHRDVKPGNVVCAGEGRPVLIDFGLALPLDADGLALTRSGELFGTAAYMSPEQLLGTSGEVDRRTDVWSLGVTMHECLTGRRPFAAPNQGRLERAIRSEPPPRACERNRILPRDLDVVLATALERDLRRRYVTALDLAEDLRCVRAREPVRARPAGLALRTRRWAQRNPVLAVAVLLLALGAGAMTIALGLLSAESVRTHEALRLAESRALAASALAMLERDPLEALHLALQADALSPGVESRAALFRALAVQQVERVVETRRIGNTAAFTRDRDALVVVDEGGRRMVAFDLPAGRAILAADLPVRSRAVAAAGRAQCVATGLDDGRILVWRAPFDREAETWRSGDHTIRALAFSPDDALLASAGDDDLVHLWDVATGAHVAALAGSLGPPCGLAFSPDGARLASWVQELPDIPDRPDPIVRVFDVSGRHLETSLAGHSARVTVARFSPDGNLLASASDDRTVRVWELATGRCRELLEHEGAVIDAAFSPDGRRLATGFDPGDPESSRAGGMRIHDLGEGGPPIELRGHQARAVASIDWSPDGQQLASGSYDGTARVWDASDGRELACLRTTDGYVLAVRWIDDGRRLVVRQYWRTLVVRPRGDAGMPSLAGHDAAVTDAAWSPDGTRLATCAADGRTLVHDARDGRTLARLDDGRVALRRCAWAGDERVLTAADDGRVRVHDARGGACLVRIAVGDAPVGQVVVLPDGERVVAASGASAGLFSIADGRRLVDYRGHTGAVHCLDLSDDGRLLATGAADRSARVWDLATGACLTVCDDWLPTAFETEHEVFAVRFRGGANSLFTASEDGILRSFALPGGEPSEHRGVNARFGSTLRLDGDRLALVPKWSPRVVVLDPRVDVPIQLHPPMVGRVLASAVSDDPPLLLAAGTDGTAVAWDARDLSPWAVFRVDEGPILCAAFAPDGSAFVTGAANGAVRVWPTDPAAAARTRRAEIVSYKTPP